MDITKGKVREEKIRVVAREREREIRKAMKNREEVMSYVELRAIEDDEVKSRKII